MKLDGGALADRPRRRHEGLGSQVLGEARVTTPVSQVAVDLVDGTVVELNEATHLPMNGIAHT